MVGEVEGFGVDVCSQIRPQAADNLRDEAYPFLLWGAGASVLALELLQRFRLLQVSRVKALGEPVVDLCQQLVGCLPLALLLPVVYLRYADKYFGLLASRLRGVYQPVISTPNPFLGPHPHPLASICAYGAPQHHDHQISAVC